VSLAIHFNFTHCLLERDRVILRTLRGIVLTDTLKFFQPVE